jgi:hypothetical protein
MTREEAVAAASDWLQSRSHRVGVLRFAGYAWDFRSGYGLWNGLFTRGLITIPSLDTLPPIFWLVHGWLVVFNPSGSEPEHPDGCVVCWVDEVSGRIRGRFPQGEFDLTFSLTGQ